MGKKGAKLTPSATAAAEGLMERLGAWMPVNSRKMFGGYGIFSEDKMFALVNSAGTIHFKVGDANRKDFEGAEQHGKMPYFEAPAEVLADDDRLRACAEKAARVAHE